MNIDDKQALVDAVKRLAGLVEAIDVDPVPEPKRPVVLGTWDHSRSVDGVTGVDTEMAALVGRPRTVNGFRRGYTSGGHPVSFADSPVRWAESTWGHAAMLNTKNHGDYDTALAGGFDDLWAGYWRSVPVGVRLWQTWQHEPENDRGIDADKWCRAVGRYVNVAAPIIRERGLDAGVGGLLMGYTKPAEVRSRWAWWEHVDPGESRRRPCSWSTSTPSTSPPTRVRILRRCSRSGSTLAALLGSPGSWWVRRRSVWRSATRVGS